MTRTSTSIAVLLGLAASPFSAFAATEKQCPPGLEADSPTVPLSLEQTDINSGALSFDEINDHGELLFVTKFNTCDGRGRPETTGGGAKRAIPTFDDEGRAVGANIVAKTRSSAPDSDACAGCHAQPEPGGAGDFVANVFVLAQTLDPLTQDIDATHANDRNTLAMHGSGPIEMLAREMTVELQAAAAGLPDGVHTISSKGVDFQIEISGGAVVATDGGIDHDLIIKPFHQAGKVISLREFSTNAMNHHHGMQAEERFDLNPAKGFDPDYDNDGYERELTIGDQTAISIWQAQLSTPVQVKPRGKAARKQVRKGEKIFDDVGCTSCHVPEMALSSRDFVEPNPFNPPGTCAGAADGCPDYSFDMTKDGDKPRLKKGRNGTAIIRAYTDMKRHNLCDDPGPGAIRWFCNEELAQGRPDDAFEGKPGTEYFLTRKLWDVGNTDPYGHRGDVTTITEAILLHGGEGRASRDAFEASSVDDQKAVVAFLKTLQIVPQGDDDEDDD
ncbi:di-heme oxidoreductase (putative peroxidase) [Thiogranum longum]|uniref:Di-heme oxidoreductase (Putative peroxidase) n=1 Tax=Thiogranum longum TaxID=1537524 RepID=A0A4R1HJU5_9GAMM|nr:di-heme oxidoredictase family protein [Thiogranum longum]TCK17502.1 di-heme oxidoreductase (putative peroxidase) [Thiogranum longum]